MAHMAVIGLSVIGLSVIGLSVIGLSVIGKNERKQWDAKFFIGRAELC
jgi:hypothetical protein